MAVQTERRLFTVEEYHRMGEAGVLTEDDRVELIEGEIVTMPPIGEGHARSVDSAAELFITRLGQRARIRIQGPVDVGQRSEFQPDLAVLRREPERGGAEHPGPDDILLIIEVADTSGRATSAARSPGFLHGLSLERDRGLKLPIYARAGVREVWIVNLRAGLIEVYRQPVGGVYREVLAAGRGQRLAISTVPAVSFTADEILG